MNWLSISPTLEGKEKLESHWSPATTIKYIVFLVLVSNIAYIITGSLGSFYKYQQHKSNNDNHNNNNNNNNNNSNNFIHCYIFTGFISVKCKHRKKASGLYESEDKSNQGFSSQYNRQSGMASPV